MNFSNTLGQPMLKQELTASRPAVTSYGTDRWISDIYVKLVAELTKSVCGGLRPDLASAVADEIVAKAFLELICQIGRGKLQHITPDNWLEAKILSDLRGWLFTTARFIRLAVIRREMRHNGPVIDWENVPSRGLSDDIESRDLVATMLSRVTPRGRLVLLRTFFDGRTDAAIAKELATSELEVKRIRYNVYRWLRGESRLHQSND